MASLTGEVQALPGLAGWKRRVLRPRALLTIAAWIVACGGPLPSTTASPTPSMWSMSVDTPHPGTYRLLHPGYPQRVSVETVAVSGDEVTETIMEGDQSTANVLVAGPRGLYLKAVASSAFSCRILAYPLLIPNHPTLNESWQEEYVCSILTQGISHEWTFSVTAMVVGRERVLLAGVSVLAIELRYATTAANESHEMVGHETSDSLLDPGSGLFVRQTVVGDGFLRGASDVMQLETLSTQPPQS